MEQEQAWQPTLASLFDSRQFFQIHLPPDELAHRVLGAVTQATGASRASLMLLDEDERSLVIKAAVGLLPEVVATTRVKPGEGIAGWVAQSGHPLLLPDGSNDSDVPTSIREALIQEQITSALCVPLEAGGRVLGVLNLARQGDGASFTQRDLWFASSLADGTAMALHNARLHSQLESRERFITRIQDSVPSSLVVIDRALRVVSVNRNFLEKARRKAETTLGSKIEEVFPRVLVEYTRLDQKVREVFRTGRPVEGGKVAYRAPGLPTRIYYYRLIPLRTQEAVENVMLLMDDITEREQLGEEVRRAERHLASVVECANDIVVSMNADGRILTWNPAAEQISGHRSREVIGHHLATLCLEEQQKDMRSMLRRLARGKGIEKAEISLVTKTGKAIPVAWACSTMRDDGGQIVGLVGVGRDLTERRQLEAQLIQSAKMASLGVMAGGIAHEIRNPLGISSAAAQLLLEKADDERLRVECAEKINSGIQRASYIIENLLKFARPPEERLSPMDTNMVLDETLTLLANQIRVQRIEVKKDFDPDLPLLVGNKSLLQQVFSNLILNACKAMPEGGELTIATRLNFADQMEIGFTDTGCGIPPEDLNKIFDPFFTTRPVGEGTGLGLSITYGIVQQHGGSIDVESAPGAGSTFIVRLPLTAAGPHSPPAPPTLEGTGGGEGN